MTLKEIVSKLTELESGFKSLFSAKEDNAEVVALGKSLEAIQATVAGQLTELSSVNESLKQENLTLSASATAINESLNNAIAALKLETNADATAAEKIEALQNGVSTTVAKLSVKATDIPVAGVKPEATSENTFVTKFNAITDPAERVKFIKSLKK